MKKIKLGIIGLGGMGLLHLRNCQLLNDVDIAVSDNIKSAIENAKELGVKEHYDNYHDLIKKGNLDAVIISLPNYLHKECIFSCAEEKLDVFIEKPLARNSYECQEIIDCIEKNNVKLMVGFFYRFFEEMIELKSLINEGALGDIDYITCAWSNSGPYSPRWPQKPVPEWWFSLEKVGGGALLDQGCHMIDLIRWLLDDEAEVTNIELDHKFNLPLEDKAIMSLKFRKGTRANIMVGWFSKQNSQRIGIYGTMSSKEYMLLNNKFEGANIGKIISVITKNIIDKLLGKQITPYALSTDITLFNEIKYFVDCMREEKTPSITAKDGLECAKLIDSAYQMALYTNSRENS